MVGKTYPATYGDAVLLSSRPKVTRLEAGLFINVNAAPNPPNDVLIKEVLETCWVSSIVWKMEKSGTPANSGKDKVKIVFKRLKENGEEETLIDQLVTEFLDVVWGRNNQTAPPIAVTNYDNTNNAYGLILLFKEPIYCPKGYRLRALNTSNVTGVNADNYLVSALVETIYIA